MSARATKPVSAFHADLLLVVITLLAAAGWIFSRETIAGLPPLTFIALRFTGAGLLLIPFCHRALKQMNRQQWRAALVVGVMFGIAMVFWITGLQLTRHVGVGSFLCSLSLVMVPFVSLFFGDRPGAYAFVALPFAMAGLACLSLDGSFHLGPAEGCFLMSALIFALMYVLNSRAAARTPALPLTAIQLLITGFITTIGAIGFETPSLQQPASIWAWFLASMLIATAFRFVLQTYAMGMSPPSHTAIIMNLEPVWTALLAVLWLQETLSQLQLAGCGLIFVAMLLNRWPVLRRWLRPLFSRSSSLRNN